MQRKIKTSLPLRPESWFFSFLLKKFLFFEIFELFLIRRDLLTGKASSDYEKRITVRTELIVHFKGSPVCLHYIFEASECGNRHQHGGTGTVEV